MQQVKFFLLLILICFFIGCGGNNSTSFAYYREVPEFIKSFLDSQSDSVFRIAEPGEPWDRSCPRSRTLPECEFISAEITPTRFKMLLWTGNASISKRVFKLKFKGTEVVEFWVDNYRLAIKGVLQQMQ